MNEAIKSKVDVIVLPETFSFMGNTEERLSCAKKNFKKTFDTLKEFAQKTQAYLVGGSLDEFNDSVESEYESDHSSNKLFNTCFTFSPAGHVVSEYRKLHLFNLYHDSGEKNYCESEVYKAGSAPNLYSICMHKNNWDALNIICYDLRFPEIIRQLGQPCDLIFIPAAFAWETGKDHWEVLLRARAIENQCYVVACNQTGTFANNQKRNYGNSMVVDPWGQVIARLGEEEGLLICDIYKDQISKSRKKLPALNDRKIF